MKVLSCCCCSTSFNSVIYPSMALWFLSLFRKKKYCGSIPSSFPRLPYAEEKKLPWPLPAYPPSEKAVIKEMCFCAACQPQLHSHEEYGARQQDHRSRAHRLVSLHSLATSLLTQHGVHWVHVHQLGNGGAGRHQGHPEGKVCSFNLYILVTLLVYYLVLL